MEDRRGELHCHLCDKGAIFIVSIVIGAVCDALASPAAATRVEVAVA